MPEVQSFAVAGLIPPQLAEARIRERWPSVQRFPAVASLGRALTKTIILAPLAWLLMAPFYFSKVLPVFARRYTLTNRRVMIRAGWSGKIVGEVALADIDEVRVVTDANSDFYRAATLEIISGGQVKLSLPGMPEPESFKHAILNACTAWVPGKAKMYPFVPASEETAPKS